MIDRMVAWLLSFGLQLLTGAHGRWSGCGPVPGQRIYCVNHSSHLDFLLLWTALPGRLRRVTRPVAAADYWNAGPIRRYVIHRVFRGVLVDRIGKSAQPFEPMFTALEKGESLIFFPEGTRGPGEGLLPLKGGIYHVAREWRSVAGVSTEPCPAKRWRRGDPFPAIGKRPSPPPAGGGWCR